MFQCSSGAASGCWVLRYVGVFDEFDGVRLWWLRPELLQIQRCNLVHFLSPCWNERVLFTLEGLHHYVLVVCVWLANYSSLSSLLYYGVFIEESLIHEWIFTIHSLLKICNSKYRVNQSTFVSKEIFNIHFGVKLSNETFLWWLF